MDAVAGFNAVCSIGKGQLCAVGFHGEIWLRLDGKWRSVESPTNVILHAACKGVRDGEFYSCGQLGVVTRGNLDRIETIDTGDLDDNLWGCASFADRIYFASDSELFTWEGETFSSIATGLPPGFSHRQLHANNGALWSFGMHHIAVTTDGNTWRDVTPRKGEIDVLF